MEDLARIAVDRARKEGASFADVRIESLTGTNVIVMDGKTKTLTVMRELGCGIRAFSGGAWGFAATNKLTTGSVSEAAKSAARMAKVARAKAKIQFEITPTKAISLKEEYKAKEKSVDVPMEEKVRFAIDLDRSMRSVDQRISSTNARYDDLEADRVVANSFGTLSRTKERWLIASCSAWAKEEGVIQRGHAANGSVGGYELMRTDDSTGLGVKAAEMAIRLLDSKPAPAGKHTVILDNIMTGLLAHEAFGHACEADGVLSGASVLEGKLGTKVADESISLVDDPTVKDTFGYFSSDWEGVKSKKHVLIDRGTLKEFLQNLETGSRVKLPSNGAARSQAYNSPPIIRMSNTYIGPGDYSKEELFGMVKDGLLIKGGQYGYVEPAKGQFMFKCDEAYQIKNGEVGQRYRDASVMGLILEVLNNVGGVGKDLILGDPGYCGKGGQSARTTDGGPHICIKNMVVGGLT